MLDFGFLNWLWIIPVLGLLVFVHELGHFVTARLNGIRVDEFGLGFPPRLFGIRRGGVLYSINALPIGGFVRIYGENGENVDQPGAFGAKKPWQRALVLCAGSAMNILLAFLIFALLAMTGIPSPRGAQVAEVAPGSPASISGLRPADKIRSIDGTPIVAPDDVVGAFRPVTGREVSVVVDRSGQPETLRVTARANPPAGQGAIGIKISEESIVEERYGPVAAVGIGATRTVETVGLMITGLSDLITGRASTGDLAGPVGIAQLTSEIADQGRFKLLLGWTALLSLNLFLVNMLPLPALDGGRLVFVLLEAIRRKKVAPQREAFVHAVGMMLLLTFLVVISIFDVQRIVQGGSILP
ncbi:MAG: RIP metalloprotease RseP [Chloroflexota bacterium]|nr:RIP metalloprotease RseP [Chloroflexota bacterium]